MKNMSAPIEDTSGIVRNYALMALGFPMLFISYYFVPALGGLMLLYSLFSTYRLRKKLTDTVICKNHAQWILRTFWISIVYALIGYAIAAAIIQANADTADIEGMRQALVNKTATPDEVILMMTEFHQKNAPLIYWTQLLAFAPCLLFFALRCIKGYILAEKYKIVPNVKTWLI